MAGSRLNFIPGSKAMEELDLYVADMDSEEAEQKAAQALKLLSGVESMRLVNQGVWLTYDPEVTSSEKICHALGEEGLHASVFQDSHTGEEGKAPS
jgi:hypothetical protein